jgi:hypothetical protein
MMHGIMTAFRLQSIDLEGETSTTRALALLSQAGPVLVAATGATATTTAARQLPRGRSRFRGEWEHTPVFFWRACAAQQERRALPKKRKAPPYLGGGALVSSCALLYISPLTKKKE